MGAAQNSTGARGVYVAPSSRRTSAAPRHRLGTTGYGQTRVGRSSIRQCCPSLVRILRAAMARESDPTAMLGLVILVIVAELLAIAVGVTFGMFIG